LADSIFGVPYANVFQIILQGAGGVFMGGSPDPGTFADDGGTPPQTYHFTANNGAWVVGGNYDSIIAVVGTTPG
jgi:hypothetical protein